MENNFILVFIRKCALLNILRPAEKHAGRDLWDAPPTQLSAALWRSGGERRPASKRPAVVLVPVPPTDADGQSSKFRRDSTAEGLELYSR